MNGPPEPLSGTKMRRSIPRGLDSLTLAVLIICGATIAGGQTASEPAAAPAASDVSAGKPAAPADAFQIGAEDVLFIRVLHEPDLTGSQDVRPDGMISMQLIGAVKAAGLTPEQLSAAIREKLLATMKNPEVSVQVTKVNSRKFTIQGEVHRPGTYTFESPVTVLEALVNGQGFTDFANPKKIYLLRKGERLKFNYKEVSHGKHTDENIQVQNGDQIFVP